MHIKSEWLNSKTELLSGRISLELTLHVVKRPCQNICHTVRLTLEKDAKDNAGFQKNRTTDFDFIYEMRKRERDIRQLDFICLMKIAIAAWHIPWILQYWQETSWTCRLSRCVYKLPTFILQTRQKNSGCIWNCTKTKDTSVASGELRANLNLSLKLMQGEMQKFFFCEHQVYEDKNNIPYALWLMMYSTIAKLGYLYAFEFACVANKLWSVSSNGSK